MTSPARAHPYAEIPAPLLAELRVAAARLQMLDPWERLFQTPLGVTLPGLPHGCAELTALLSPMMVLNDSMCGS